LRNKRDDQLQGSCSPLDTPDRVNDKQNTIKSALVRVGFTRRFLNVNQPKSIILGVRRKVRKELFFHSWLPVSIKQLDSDWQLHQKLHKFSSCASTQQVFRLEPARKISCP